VTENMHGVLEMAALIASSSAAIYNT